MVRLLDSWILGWLGFWILKNCIRYQVIIPTFKVSNYKVDHVKLIIDNLKCNIQPSITQINDYTNTCHMP